MSNENDLPIEQRVSLLEAKLRVVADGLQRIGYESDGGGRLAERFGVDAAACRKLLNMIGAPVQQQVSSKQPQPEAPGTLFKPVTWSKDPSFRFG